MNFYKRHIGDYLRDTAHLSLLEHGIYTRLLDVYYTREGAIPHEQASRLIGARSRDEREAVERVLSEFFVRSGDSWVQRRCEREIEAANQKAERNREVGRLGGRKPKNGNHDGANKEPTNNPDGFQAEPTNNPSQTPDSRLQTPEASTHTESPPADIARGQSADSAGGGIEPPDEGEQATAAAFLRSIRAEADDDPPVEPTKHGLMAAELRRRGVRCTSAHPELVALVDDGFTVPEVVEALAVAVMADAAPKPMNVGYLAAVARTQREAAKRPKKAAAAWWASDEATAAKGAELGLQARSGEDWNAYRQRIRARLSERAEA